jgi:hypothetical protein
VIRRAGVLLFAWSAVGCALDAIGEGPLATGGGASSTSDASSSSGSGAGGASGSAGGMPGTGAGGAGGAATSTGGADNAGGAGGAGGSEPIVPIECPPGSFVTAIDSAGLPSCTPLASAAKKAVNTSCRLDFGWQDYCENCSDPPSRIGWTRPGLCDTSGTNTLCSIHDLGGTPARLLSINTGGLVDYNDRFHIGFTCFDPPSSPTTGACPEGSFASAFVHGEVTCTPAANAILAWARSGGSVYLGIRDACSGSSCADPPNAWIRVSTDSFSPGAGTNNNELVTSVLGATVRLGGLRVLTNADNDRFYAGIAWSAPPPDEVVAATCPPDFLARGTDGLGNLICASPLPDAAATLNASCRLFVGHRNECTTCTDPPYRWAHASGLDCVPGPSGACIDATLDGTLVHLASFGLTGDVNGNDRFYVAFDCN